MCQIITKDATSNFPRELIMREAEVNSDGWGIAYAHDNQLTVARSMDPTQIPAALDAVPENAIGFIHLRWATSGNKHVMNCHPFKLGDHIAFAQNGVTPHFVDYKSPKSDTALFAEWLARRINKTQKRLDPIVPDIQTIDNISRFVLLNSRGEMTIVGTWKHFSKGVYCSSSPITSRPIYAKYSLTKRDLLDYECASTGLSSGHPAWWDNIPTIGKPKDPYVTSEKFEDTDKDAFIETDDDTAVYLATEADTLRREACEEFRARHNLYFHSDIVALMKHNPNAVADFVNLLLNETD